MDSKEQKEQADGCWKVRQDISWADGADPSIWRIMDPKGQWVATAYSARLARRIAAALNKQPEGCPKPEDGDTEKAIDRLALAIRDGADTLAGAIKEAFGPPSKPQHMVASPRDSKIGNAYD